MGFEILKPGVFDTLQDLGRYGYAHWGINPNGAMDWHSARLANILVGNDENEAVIEMHFPAGEMLVTEHAVVVFTGADFSPSVNEQVAPLRQPISLPKGSIIRFRRKLWGARCYIAVRGGFNVSPWLSSYSTNTRVQAGGFFGRILNRGDVLLLRKPYGAIEEIRPLPFHSKTSDIYHDHASIRFIEGREWRWLSEDSRKRFEDLYFTIDSKSDRMAYRLNHVPLTYDHRTELLSSGVSYGTIQGLPDGMCLILMADHQTTGGYPRIGNVITADLPKLAQRSPSETFQLKRTTLAEAEKVLHSIRRNLEVLKLAVREKWKSYESN